MGKCITGVNDLLTLRPDLADEWNYDKNKDLKNAFGDDISTPDKVVPGSNRKVWWRCQHNHEYETQVMNRSNGHGCPYCAGLYVIKGKTDLSTKCPHLIEQWHPTKNKPLTPSDVSCKSNKKYWWICEKQHEYQATINSKTRGSECPYCSGRFAIPGETDFATAYPELLAEWHPIKNYGLDPTELSPRSHKKVWWICQQCETEWLAMVGNRTKGSGCPQCSKKRSIVVGIDDFATKRPAMVKEWHPTLNGNLKPTDVRISSNKNVFWLCEYGHVWQTTVKSRTGDDTGCPICANQQLLSGYNDLKTICPELAAEWHPTKNGALRPTDVTGGTKKTAWWIGVCGHEWESRVVVRTKGSGCPYCANQKLLVGFNDVATTHPHILSDWHPTKNGELQPTDIITGSHTKVWWQCENGHEWQTRCSSRTKQKDATGCPYCNTSKFLKGFNDLLTTHPDLIATEWDFDKNTLLPHELTKSSKHKVWWKCKCGHSYQALISNKTRDYYDCPVCSGRQIIMGQNDLTTTNPDLSEEWHPTKNGNFTPTQVTKTSNQKVWWLGKCGHEWESRVFVRTKGSGCPYCANQKLLVGFNDLATTHPHLIKEWHSTLNGSLQPIDVSRGSVNKVWWICDNGHTYESRVNTRTKGSGCPHCNNSRGENEIANILTQQNVVFRVQNVFSDRIYSQKLRDDFAILKNDHVIATIEYNGIQHYEPVDFAGKGDAWAKKQLKNTQARDIAKSKYLCERGIPQLIIPYWEFDNIPTLVQNFISTL